MALAERRANVTWQGDLLGGSGKVSTGSGALETLDVTWASRVERSDGRTSPEELIAAAHASCYAMAFSNVLAKAGTPPEVLDVSAVCTVAKTDSGIKVGSIMLTVKGKVAGLDQAAFEQAARDGERACPVSNALRGNVEISVSAELIPA